MNGKAVFVWLIQQCESGRRGNERQDSPNIPGIPRGQRPQTQRETVLTAGAVQERTEFVWVELSHKRNTDMSHLTTSVPT